MNFDAQPAKYGLYDPVNEEDACGVSFVADMTGKETLATAFVGSSRVPAPAGQEQLLCPSAGISRRAATCTERSCMGLKLSWLSCWRQQAAAAHELPLTYPSLLCWQRLAGVRGTGL